METLEGDKKKDWYCPTYRDPTPYCISCILVFLLILQTAWVTYLMLSHCNVSAYSLICSGEVLMTRRCIGSLISIDPEILENIKKKKKNQSLDKVVILR